MTETKVARVRLREFGPVELFRLGAIDINVGDWCVVSFDRGEDYGKILCIETLSECDISENQHVVRECQTKDDIHIKRNRKDATGQIKGCQREIITHNLEMKIIDAEYTFDKSKIVFYFAAEERVDFRKLVRDLAKKLKVRIELHQVGVRDETKITGGIGCCGRITCCKSWIHEFQAVNIRMAKLQQIQLHPTKLSGVCGRLKCCLAYEYKNYRELEQTLPRKGQRVRTPEGTGDVIDASLLKQTVTVKTDDDSIGLYPAAQVTVVSRSKARAKVRAQKRRTKGQPGQRGRNNDSPDNQASKP